MTYTESQPYKALIKTCIRHKQLPVSHRSQKPFAYISRSNYSIKQSIIFFEVGIVQILIVRSPLLLSPKGNRSAVDFYFSAKWHRKPLDVISLTSNRTANIWYLTKQTARRHNPRRMSAFGPAHARVVGEGGLNI